MKQFLLLLLQSLGTRVSRDEQKPNILSFIGSLTPHHLLLLGCALVAMLYFVVASTAALLLFLTQNAQTPAYAALALSGASLIAFALLVRAAQSKAAPPVEQAEPSWSETLQPLLAIFLAGFLGRWREQRAHLPQIEAKKAA